MRQDIIMALHTLELDNNINAATPITIYDIKKHFRELALQLHPDRNIGKNEDVKQANEEKFKQINSAYELLLKNPTLFPLLFPQQHSPSSAASTTGHRYHHHTTFFSQNNTQSTTSASATTSATSSTLFDELLKNVLWGNEAAVKKTLDTVLKKNPYQLPELLSNVGNIRNFSGRMFFGVTLLQAAAREGDAEMCEMLKNYLKPDQFEKQLKIIFLEGIAVNERNQSTFIFDLQFVDAAIQAASIEDLNAALLNKKNNGSTLCKKMKEFRSSFVGYEPFEGKNIFNPQHMLHAFKVYEKLCKKLQDDNDLNRKKRDLFWIQVIGFIQRFLPACYAQAFVKGLNQTTDGRADPYFPIPSGIGYDYAICPMTGRQTKHFYPSLSSLLTKTFERLCETSAAKFRAFLPEAQPNNNARSTCVMQ